MSGETLERRLTHGSLFAGIGGFDLGFERAGIETVWQVEIDPFCRKVLAKHFPHAERFEDVREVGKHNLRAVDVICGGFPCQDVSQANTVDRCGLDGERSGLWSEYLRIIGELRPRFVLVENVSALLVRGIERVLGDLAEVGYDAEWESLPAAAFGAPHIRDRVWILAYPGCQLGEIQDCRNHGCHFVLPQGVRERRTSEWGEDRELIALVPGIDSGTPADWWRNQSRMDRSADGLPDSMDRVTALGNAVVPQIAEWIGKRIVASCERSSI